MKNTFLYTVIKDFFLMHIAHLLTPKKDIFLPQEIYSTNIPQRKISCCTTCMGRLDHLKKTYLKNILDNENYSNKEFVLINYNSTDGMDEWVKENLMNYIEKGIVNYYHTKDPKGFHMAKAKNLAHRLATGEIVVNLDADNFIGKDSLLFLNNLYNDPENENIVFWFSKNDFRFYDTAGKIALKKKYFEKIGGYREDLNAYGDEDLDFIKRLGIIGCKTNKIEIINFLRTVKHSTFSRIKNHSKIEKLSTIRTGNQWILNNKKLMFEYLANEDGFQKFIVYKNFSEVPLIV